jgi:GDP-mannose 6-dehydrogenase
MRLIVWGLGYVGTVTAACFARLGHDVIGIEPNQTKVDAINAGQSAIVEPGLEVLVKEVVDKGKFRAATDGLPYIGSTDVSLICVGTPSAADGSTNIEYIRNVAATIGEGLRDAEGYHVIVLRSTLFPNLVHEELIATLGAHSGKVSGHDFGVVVNPEFLRETTAISDFFAPPYTIIGELDQRSGNVVEALYEGIEAPVYRVSLDEGAMLKMVNNAFHALKIGFANEIGRVCEALGIDSHAVMKMVCADTKLNISPAYLKPGFAFGGSCLPKDLRSLTTNARRLQVELPILEAVLPSNYLQVEAARIKVHALNAKHVGVLGLSFKPGTDDLRESPVISLIRELWHDDINVTVYDPDVKLERMLGSNFAYLQRQLPQIEQIMCADAESVISHADVVLVSQKRAEFVEALRLVPPHCTVIDLVRLGESRQLPPLERYQGISW